MIDEEELHPIPEDNHSVMWFAGITAAIMTMSDWPGRKIVLKRGNKNEASSNY
jgi:hypothetical protein